MPAPLTRSLGEFVSALRFEALPQAAVDVVRLGFIDCVAAMLAGAAEPVAAAAAIANLRGLDAERAAMALAIAASTSAGVVANFGTMTKPFQAGRAAQSGVTAARLAAAGMTASPDALEHPIGLLRALSPQSRVDTETPLDTLGRVWRITEKGLHVKKYPLYYGV